MFSRCLDWGYALSRRPQRCRGLITGAVTLSHLVKVVSCSLLHGNLLVFLLLLLLSSSASKCPDPSAIDIWGWIILCCGVILCPVGCLVSTGYQSGASPYLGQPKKVFRCCQIPLGRGGGCVCKIAPN